MGINAGILTDAYPLSQTRIAELEKCVFDDGTAFAYLDENYNLCFMLPCGIDIIKDLAWDTAYEVLIEDNILTKKVYKKSGLDTYYLSAIYKKETSDNFWVLDSVINGTLLLSSDNYILKDLNGLYLIAKESE